MLTVSLMFLKEYDIYFSAVFTAAALGAFYLMVRFSSGYAGFAVIEFIALAAGCIAGTSIVKRIKGKQVCFNNSCGKINGKKGKCEMNNKFYTVCGIVEIDGNILLVRHTYGNAKDRILLPGGFVQENELPTTAAEREIFEETGVCAKAKNLIAMQFKPEQWCAVFAMEYISGTPESDGHENSEVLLLTPEAAVNRDDITNMSREIIKTYMNEHSELNKSDYIPASSDSSNYVMFMS